MRTQLLHFGCGALGMGLTTAILSNAPSSDLYICNRRSESGSQSLARSIILQNQRFFIISTFPGKEEVIGFKDFLFFDEIDKIIKIVKKDAPLFITTALKETGIRDNIGLFSEIIITRISSGIFEPIVFVACENAIRSTQFCEELQDYITDQLKLELSIDDYVIFLDCVVDRMCNPPFIRNNNVILECEDYCSWIFEDIFDRYDEDDFYKGIRKTIQKLGDSVEIANYDIDYFIDRKKWIINAMHQMIALYSHDAKYPLITHYLNTKGGVEILKAISKDVANVFLFNMEQDDREISRREVEEYIFEFIDRVKRFPSQTNIALTRFKNEATLDKFFADFYRKTGEPALKYIISTTLPLPSITLILLKLTKLIAEKKYI